MTRLKLLLSRLERRGLLVDSMGVATEEITIGLPACDSREVRAGGLFVAIRGSRSDGHLFIDKAVNNGAIAVLCESIPEDAGARFPGIAFARVRDTRAVWAEIATAYHADPSVQLQLVGVTGTNGKTTTAYLIHHVLNELGVTSGFLGTIEYRVGTRVQPAVHTTPDAWELNRMLREMVSASCHACAMEVSSHALDQERVAGLRFAAAVFTNLTRDHLDYHGTMEAYARAKQRLFDGLDRDAFAIINVDDRAGHSMVASTAAHVVTYGTSDEADIAMEVRGSSVDGLDLVIDGQSRRLRLVGAFNAYNVLAAYATATSLGHDACRVLDALSSAPPVPGRFEQIECGDGTKVIVDYAHTPDALRSVLTTLRQMKPDGVRLWCVFGCGGDRDPEKRGMMGAIAERLADEVIVTSDNPRTEDPKKILDQIRAGMRQPDAARWIEDRRESIKLAARIAGPGDVVLIAGKGHETYQIIGEQHLPFDDRVEARKWFRASHDAAYSKQ